MSQEVGDFTASKKLLPISFRRIFGRMLPAFTDLRIVSLEEEMTVESPVRPPLRWVYFKLSETPIPLWLEAFAESRKISRHPHWRRAWIDRKFIIVECVPEEIETYHLKDLRHDIAQANRRCRQYFEKKPRTEIEKLSADAEARERLREMKSRLQFD